MPALPETFLPSSALTYLLTGGSLVTAALGAVWALDRHMSQRARKTTEARNAVMAATVLRRNRNESLALILEKTADSLQAESGTLHMYDAHADAWHLVHSVGVERLDWLARVSANDPLLQHLVSTAEDVAAITLDGDSPWAALHSAGPFTMTTTRLGGARCVAGVMVLSWPRRAQAEANLEALLGIGRYASQVLVEFEDIAERAREFQALSVELHRQEVWRRTTAHDIGNQLAMVFGPVSLLASDHDFPPEHATHLRSCLQQLSIVQALLDDLMNPGRAVEPTRVSVEGIVEMLGGLMAVRREAGAIFTLDVPTGLPDLWCERLAILRVFDNLLTNAVRHNPDAEALRLWVRAQQRGALIEFEVGDTGQGISIEAQAHLFEFGFRADSTGRIHGQGIGLWSCRRIVEGHGGRTWVASAPGQGTRFFFTLPIATEADEMPSPMRLVRVNAEAYATVGG